MTTVDDIGTEQPEDVWAVWKALQHPLRTNKAQVIRASVALAIVAFQIALYAAGDISFDAMLVVSAPALMVAAWVFGRLLTGRPASRPR